jgi:hypothetical protein
LTASSGVPASWWICWIDAAADRDMPSKDIGFDREPEAPPKQARSTKYQLTIAKVRFAKVKSPRELGDFCPRSHHAHGLPRKMVATFAAPMGRVWADQGICF